MFDTKSLTDFGAFDINLSYFFVGKKLHFGHKVTKRALINRIYCKFPEFDDLTVANMWEVEGHYQPMCAKKTRKLRSEILHDDPDPLFDYFSRHNRYSDWEAEIRHRKDLQKDIRSSRTLKGRLFDIFPGKPIVFFIYSYILKAGFLDGRAGFEYSIALSFYYWQIEIKVFEKRKNAQIR